MELRRNLLSKPFAVIVTVVFLVGCEVQDDEVTADEDPHGLLSVVGTYEAENHTFQTGCTKSTAYSGYSGAGFMDFGGNTTLVEWSSVNAPSAGQYTLSFRYANGRGSDRQCSMLINDTTNAGLVSFSPTGSWTTWGTATIKVNLKAGSNKIRVTANTNAGGPNLDKMDVMSEGSASGTCALVSEGQTANLSCPSGQVVNTITFASYGTPPGSCPNVSAGSCHASSSKSTVEAACLNKQSCTVGVNNGVFGNPCGGTAKKLAVVYTCSGSADACPNDPNKTSPGICGCGTADTDSDGDGTANCKDGCQTDPKKTAPGQCGCGVPEGSCTSASKCVEAAESGTSTLSCPSGQIIDAIAFASYGTPTGSCPNFSNGSCHASSSKSTVEAACLNKQSCSVGANNGVFGDPCAGVGKKLAVVYSCGVDPNGLTPQCPPNLPVPVIGGCNGVLLTDSSSIEAQTPGISTITGPLGGTATHINNGESIDIRDAGCLQLGNNGTSFSLSMWIKVSGASQIIGTTDAYGYRQGFTVHTEKVWWDSNLLVLHATSFDDQRRIADAVSKGFKPNTWTHVAIRYNNKGDGSTFTVDINAKSITGPAFQNVHNANLRIGDQGWGDISPFDVADLRSYQRILSDADVKSLFAEKAGVIGLSRNELADALNKLQGHIKKTVLLSADQLKTQANRFVENAIYFETDAGLMRQALDMISTYETTQGPLFMTAATNNGFSKVGTPGDGLDLARAMALIQQAVLEQVYTRSTVAACGQQILNGRRYLTADYFPGAAAPPQDPSASRDVKILASVPANWGRPVAYATDPVRRPMGLYLSPGSIVRVTVPPSMVNAGFEILVGAHTVDHAEKGVLSRLERVSKSFPITSASTSVANPLGGGLYIVVPYLANQGVVTVKVEGAIEAPFFSLKSFDTTTAQQWQTRRTAPGPWADFETDKFMMQVPRSWIYASGDPTAVMRAWDKAMDGVSEIMGFPPEKRNRTVLYQQMDVQIRANGVYGIGYPQINNTYNPYQEENGNNQNWMLTNPTANEIDYHELGHAQLMSMFRGESEAINNFPHAYLRNAKFGVNFDVAFQQSFGPSYGDVGFTPDDAATSWMVTDNFRNGNEMGYDSSNQEFQYQQRGYAKYADIYRIFGWDALRKFYYQENLDYIAKTASDGLDEVDSRILRLSVAAGGDLTPLIHFWGIHPVNTVALKQKMADRGIGASQAVRAHIERYKTIAPKNNADFNAHFERVYPGRPTGKNAYYDVLRNGFNQTHAAQIQAEIQHVINMYYQ